jgi:hypothetical protein
MIPDAAVAFDGKGGLRVSGNATTGTFVDLPDRKGKLGKTPIRIETDVALSAMADGRLQAHLNRFEAKGEFINLKLDGGQDKVAVQLPRKGLVSLLGEVMGPAIAIGYIKLLGERSFRARIGAPGQELELDGRVEVRDGDLEVRLDAMQLPGGWGRAALSGRGSNLEARLDWQELARSVERQLPLRGVTAQTLPDSGVRLEGRLSLLGVPMVPVSLDVRPGLDATGTLGAEIKSVKLAGAGLMGALGGAGLSLERLAGRGLFAGNRLKLGDLPLPPGLTPVAVAAGERGLLLTLRADSRALGIGPTVSLDGPTLRLSAQKPLGLPGGISAVRLDRGGLELEAAISERGLLPMLSPMPGVDVSRSRLVLPLGLGVGDAQSTRLQSVSVGPEGAVLTVDARPLVAGTVADLPQGMALKGDLLEVEIPKPAGLPVRASRAEVRGDGLDVVVALPKGDSGEVLPGVGQGLRWVDDGVEIDLEAWAPGARGPGSTCRGGCPEAGPWQGGGRTRRDAGQPPARPDRRQSRGSWVRARGCRGSRAASCQGPAATRQARPQGRETSPRTGPRAACQVRCAAARRHGQGLCPHGAPARR